AWKNPVPRSLRRRGSTERSWLHPGGALTSMVAYKAEEAGRELIVVNPRGTSQRCSSCGHTEAANRASQTAFCCRACGFSLHADLNAARNILWIGLSLRRQKREAETDA